MVEEDHTENAVGNPSVVQVIPEETDHDVVASIALAEAEHDSAPDMPAKKAPEVVCTGVRLILNCHTQNFVQSLIMYTNHL